MPDNSSQCGGRRTHPSSALRSGFSSGTAATAAAVAALRRLITGAATDAVAVRLPSGVYLAVPVAGCSVQGGSACASVIKDGGDDPDVTNRAEIRATVTVFRPAPANISTDELDRPEIVVSAGRGIGMVTKPGLPVPPGEPAINPVPRRMLSENITLELLRSKKIELERLFEKVPESAAAPHEPDRFREAREKSPPQQPGQKPSIRLPLYAPANPARLFSPQHKLSITVEIEAPEGLELARRTLNPRLGIIGGISILGTTGLVRPFSHEAYEKTIQAALCVAASNSCSAVVLSTGGKSERFARHRLPELAPEAFVQVADFFRFSVLEAVKSGFSGIVHSVFFGKAVKMAVGHPYTHAHAAPMDLEFLASVARSLGYGEDVCAQLASANTARHALDILADKDAQDLVESIAREAARQSARIAGANAQIRLLLFDYDGSLLADVKQTEGS